MYEMFWIVAGIAVNNMAKGKIIPELFGLLKNKMSKQDIHKFEEYILGESLKMKKALSREHMLSEDISEDYVDFVIEEIRDFLPKVRITDEICSQCGYENMKLADLLWCEYCRLNDKDKCEEYEKDLKKGLFVVAGVWNEPSEESIKECIKFLKRIDSKSSSILLSMNEVRSDAEGIKKDTKDIKKDIEDIKRDTHNTEQRVGKMDKGIENIDSKMDKGFNNIGSKLDQLLLNKSKEEQNVNVQKESIPEELDDDVESLAQMNVLSQEVFDMEETPPEEIKIFFVAASDQFQQDIESLKKFIEEQNQCQRAVCLKMQCDIGEAVTDIWQCKYCYILGGTETENWMLETYENMRSQNLNENVNLRLFLKEEPGEELTLMEDNDELKNKYGEDLSRFLFRFKDINRIKLDILQNLRREAPEVNFLPQSILQFRNNAYFAENCKKREALQIQYGEIGGDFGIDKSMEEKEDMEKLEENLREQNEIVERMEKDIWNNLSLLTVKQRNKSAMDAREAEAIEDIIEYGNYENADRLLQSKEWNQEIIDLEQFMNGKKEILRQYISSQRTLISNMKTRGISTELEDEIIKVYKRITEISKEWNIEYITIYEYAEFLLNQRKYEEGIEVGEELKCLYGLSDCSSVEDRVRLLKLLGNLYFERKKYKESENNYREALNIYQKGACENWELRANIYNNLVQLLWKINHLAEAEQGVKRNIENLSKLVKREPEVYEPILAMAYNFKAILASRRNKLDEAVEYHNKVLEIRKPLAKKSSFYNYRPVMHLTNTYNNLGFVYKKRGDYRQSEKYYKKAIDIRLRNAKRNPSVFRRAVALTYSNYATMLNLSGNNEKAQEVCAEAYRIRRDIADREEAYKVELAFTLHEYGIILTDAGERMYPQAKKYFEEAIEIREGLADEDELAYGLNLAETYCSYGKLLAKIGSFPEVEKYYRKAKENMKKACEICERYSEKNNGYDGDKISGIYYSFALFLHKCLKEYSEAKKYYDKAIKDLKVLVKRCRQVYEPKLENVEKDLAELREQIAED